MQVVVLYESLFGNTREVAEAVAAGVAEAHHRRWSSRRPSAMWTPRRLRRPSCSSSADPRTCAA